MKSLHLGKKKVPIWAAILLVAMVGSLAAMPMQGNTKVGTGEVKAQQRLLWVQDAVVNAPWVGTCQIAPNGDSMQCEALAYAGDVASITLNLANNANTASIALFTVCSDPNVEWAITQDVLYGTSTNQQYREVGQGQFAIYMPATSTETLTLTGHVLGTAPDGIFQFCFAVTPEI